MPNEKPHKHIPVLMFQDVDGDSLTLTTCPDAPGVLFLATQAEGATEHSAVAIQHPKVARIIARELTDWAKAQEALTN